MNAFGIIILILFSSFSFCDEICHPIKNPELDQLAVSIKEIDWWASSELQIQQAHCARKFPFSRDEMNQWLDNNQSDLALNETISGIKFVNETPENLRAFKELVIPKGYLGEPLQEKLIKYTSNCTKVKCALDEIFKDTGLQLLFMQRKFGFNGSHLAFNEGASAWKKSELDDILLSISDFPQGIFPLYESYPLVHAPRDENSPDIANSIIKVFNDWDKLSPSSRRSTITHELGHVIARTTEIDNQQKWLDQSGWVIYKRVINGKEVEQAYARRSDNFISKYARKNHWEDFAESVVAYRYNPNQLLKNSPDKYNIIKQVVFDNVEYRSEKECNTPQRLSHDLQKFSKDFISQNEFNDDILLKMVNRCSSLAIQLLSTHESLNLSSPVMETCYTDSLLNPRSIATERLHQLPMGQFLIPLARNVTIDLPSQTKTNRLNQLKDFHFKILFEQLENNINGIFCSPKMERHGWQGIDYNKLNVNSNIYENEIKTIVKKICSVKSQDELNNIIQLR